MTGKPAGLSLTVSLAEIYNSLCPACREAILKLFADKARGDLFQEGLRRQLEGPAHPEPVEG